jgi:hypothetical protein
MMRPIVTTLFLLAVAGGQGRVTTTLVVRAPGAPPGDSAAVADAVKRALADAKIDVVERAPSVKAGPRMKDATFVVEVTAKAMGRVGLVDLRAYRTETHELVVRVSRRGHSASLPDSATVAARQLAAKITSAGKSRK